MIIEDLSLVSVIIPTYNEEKNIGRCIASINNQDYPQELLEIIVVDNYSTDATVTIAEASTKVFSHGNERNTQRVFGASKAQGKFIMFIDADMELSESLISEAVSLCENKGYDALILPEVSIGEGFWSNCRKLEKLCYLNDRLMETPNRFIKKTAYDEVGGYDIQLIVGEDFDLGDRLINKGFRIGRTNAVILHHEVRTFRQMIKKHYYYGKEATKYFSKSKTTGLKRFFIIRPAYIRNWRLFLRDPLHGFGLIIMKIIQYLAGLVGLISSLNRGESS